MEKVQDLLDMVPLLRETPNYDIVVWEAGTQRHMKIIHTSGGKPCDEYPNGYVGFNAEYVDGIGENCVMDAFRLLMAEEGHSEDEVTDLQRRFMRKILSLRYPEPSDKK